MQASMMAVRMGGTNTRFLECKDACSFCQKPCSHLKWCSGCKCARYCRWVLRWALPLMGAFLSAAQSSATCQQSHAERLVASASATSACLNGTSRQGPVSMSN